jgi:hypothetical protein
LQELLRGLAVLCADGTMLYEASEECDNLLHTWQSQGGFGIGLYEAEDQLDVRNAWGLVLPL